MSDRNALLLLQDIETAISKILCYTTNYTLENYEADDKTREAVERNFEIIGEAAARLPETFKADHPSIEWRIIKDFRNLIIHEYFGINNQIVWDTIQLRLPDLLERIRVLIKEQQTDSPAST